MKEWYRAKELVGLPGMPGTDRVIRLKMQGMVTRTVAAPTGGKPMLEAHIDGLPEETRAALRKREAQESLPFTPGPRLEPSRPVMPIPTPSSTLTPARQGVWAWFERQPERVRAEGIRRAEAVRAFDAASPAAGRMAAAATVAAQYGVHPETLRSWAKGVRDTPTGDWAPMLASHRERCGRVRADIPRDAWDTFLADYLRPEQPSARSCYERLERIAGSRGWELPSVDTFERRIKELPIEMRVLGREGEDALERLYPNQKRVRSVFHALEAVNADGHRFDVFARWEDGTVCRPVGVFFQDLYSGKMLAYRLAQSENRHSVRLALADVVRVYGKPSEATFDNGRGFAAKWLTGGTEHRFRFKVQEEELQGILPALGVTVHFTLPYSGKSKPIERAFRDLCDYVSRHPAFAGAYTGNSVENKPSNYGEKAVDIAIFRQVLEAEIIAHNARTGRRSDVCKGQSFDQVFAASYASSPIQQATPEQLRMLLLAGELTTANRQTGMVSLPGAPGNQYWCEDLTALRGQRVVVRFDPERLADGVHVYTEQGQYVTHAAPWGAVAFNDMDAAQTHGRNRRSYVKHTKKAFEALNRMTPEDVAAQLPAVPSIAGSVVDMQQAAERYQGKRMRGVSREASDEEVDNLLAIALGR